MGRSWLTGKIIGKARAVTSKEVTAFLFPEIQSARTSKTSYQNPGSFVFMHWDLSIIKPINQEHRQEHGEPYKDWYYSVFKRSIINQCQPTLNQYAFNVEPLKAFKRYRHFDKSLINQLWKRVLEQIKRTMRHFEQGNRLTGWLKTCPILPFLFPYWNKSIEWLVQCVS